MCIGPCAGIHVGLEMIVDDSHSRRVSIKLVFVEKDDVHIIICCALSSANWQSLEQLHSKLVG